MAAASEERMAEEGGGGHGDGGSCSAAGSAQRQPPPPPSQAPQPGSQVSAAPALAPDQLPPNNTLVALPIVAIENILSFMSYDEISQLRLVIDEIYRVLRYVNSTRAPQRAHEVLQELRDISSMAMEYFDEKIVPILKRKLPGSDVSGRLMGSPPVPGPSAALTTMQLFSKQNPSRQEVTKLQQQVKTNGAGVTVLRREISELRTKVQEQQKQLQDQDQKLLEQTQIIGEQNARLAELERKLREVMESAVGTSSGSGQNEESPRKRRKATEAIDSLRKSKRLRNRK
ncbi:F-box only protein 28 isoform X2 [Nannospalax galili]|uniref:F-box only protein 28 isoform X2 n=1 Tax=Nannospalax galili TaxID=1026970 RepID=UPI00111C39D8|nr:F-box only protein 28 isoform X2 [Nannospalax galili]